MKKIGLFLMSVLLFLNGCERGEIIIDEVQKPIKLSFSEQNVTAILGSGAFTESMLIGHKISEGEITYIATKSSVATVESKTGKVNIVGLGEVEIIATQAATKKYKAGNASYKITVIDKTAVHLRFSSGSVTVANSSATVTEPTLIGHRVSSGKITYTSNNTAVATVNATTGKITLKGIGTTTITATQAATATHKASSASYTLTVGGKIPVNLRFSSGAVTVANSSATVSEPTLSGHRVSSGKITYTSNNTAVASVNATTGKITLKGIGTTTITATQASTATHKASSASYTLTVGGKIPVNLRFSSGAVTVANRSATVTEPTLIGHRVSSGKITYTSNNTAVATVNATTGKLTLKGVGTTTITATQATTATHKASSASYTLTVGGKIPVNLRFSKNIAIADVIGAGILRVRVTFTEPTLVGHTVSSGAVTYTSSNPANASVNPKTGKVTLHNISWWNLNPRASVTITATQAATATHKASSASYRIQFRSGHTKATVSLGVATNLVIAYKGATSITEPPLRGHTVSTGKITYTSSDTTIATVDTDTGKVTLTGKIGRTRIEIRQQATATHHEGVTSYTIEVKTKRKITTRLDFSSKRGHVAKMGDTFAEPTLTGKNGSPGKVTYTSSDTTIATVDKNTGKITALLKFGNVVITATIAEAATKTTLYTTSTASYHILVVKKDVSFTLSSRHVTATLGSPFVAPTLTILTVNTGRVTYTSNDTSIVTVDKATGKVTLKKAGTTYITIRQAATPMHLGFSTRYTITVLPAKRTTKTEVYMSFSMDRISAVMSAAIPNLPMLQLDRKGSTGKITYSSSVPSVATVDNKTGKITKILSIGTTIITATIAETATHKSKATICELRVIKHLGPILVLSKYRVTAVLGKSVTEPTLSGQIVSKVGYPAGAMVYTSSNTSVATVDSTGKLTLVGVGTTTIQVRQMGTNWHLGKSIFYTLVVTQNSSCNGATQVTIGGRSYDVVEINGKCWMAEPLRLLRGFTNGNMKDYSLTRPYYYTNAAHKNYYTYYNWAAAVSFAKMSHKPVGVNAPSSWGTKKIPGWHLPSAQEYRNAFGGGNLGTTKISGRSIPYRRFDSKVHMPLGGIYLNPSYVGRSFVVDYPIFSSTGKTGNFWTESHYGTANRRAIAQTISKTSSKVTTKNYARARGLFILLVKD